MNGDCLIPSSFNVCRGQAGQGIGEPGSPIRRGEQYLAADGPLRDDPALLRAIREWLTLDASPGDHGRLQDRLEGWSCFPAGPYYFVVRLGVAGKYDRRDAYFAHGRAWPLSAFSDGFDPGLYLGQGEAFLHQAPAAGAQPDTDLPLPTIEPLAPILAGKRLATSLIAHLLHGMLAGLPVILAVPVTEFSSAAPLARIVALARGALPGRLRRRCRVRVFSRNPESFLVAGGADAMTGPADLLVIPEELAGHALAAVRRQALLLDGNGERCDGPSRPGTGPYDYARAVVESAQRFPSHLTGFGERFDRLWGDADALPGPELTGWVALIYNLTVALAGTEARCGSLFANFLLAQARTHAQVPWPALIRPEDWARFPLDQLVRTILRADDDLSPGERRLQASLVDAFQRLGRTIDAGLTAWWNPADVQRRRRLLELCALDPPLISNRHSAALTSALTIDDLAACGGPLTGVLRAEYRVGRLAARQGETPGLLAHLEEAGLFELLLEADQTGVLTPPWRSGDLADLPLPKAMTLARRLLHDPPTWAVPPDLPARLVARLMAEPQGLATLPTDLFDGTGRLRITCTPDLAVLLLDCPTITARLGARDLLALADLLPGTAGQTLAACHRHLSDQMEQGPDATTALLIETGAWLSWRRGVDRPLDADTRRRFALAWITSPALGRLREEAARERPPQWRLGERCGGDDALVDINRETWHQVLADLGQLGVDDIHRLTQPATHWPWLYPFQKEQARELAALCRDREGREALATDLYRPETWTDDGEETPPAWRDFIADVITELSEGTVDGLALSRLRLHVRDLAHRGDRRARLHPLWQLRQGVRRLPSPQRGHGNPLMAHGWHGLQRIIAAEGCWHDWALLDTGRPILPLFHLAASLQPHRQAGALALWLIYEPGGASLRIDPRWWEALIGSVLGQTAPSVSRGPAGDAADWVEGEATCRAALALIDSAGDALPEAERLALGQAWRILENGRDRNDPLGAIDR